MKIDLHIHSKYSGDALNSPEDIIKGALKSGLQGVAVVDHGTIKGGEATAKATGNSGLVVITGAEIKTDRGEVIGYFLNDEISSTSLMEVIDEMRAQDALITIPHPFDAFRKNRIKRPAEIADRIDSVEVFNSRCILDSSNKKALEFSIEQGLSVTAGSDAHHPEEIGSAGIDIRGDRIRAEMTRNKEFFGRKNPLLLHARATFQRLIPR